MNRDVIARKLSAFNWVINRRVHGKSPVTQIGAVDYSLNRPAAPLLKSASKSAAVRTSIVQQ
jgi:hypothetical protein